VRIFKTQTSFTVHFIISKTFNFIRKEAINLTTTKMGPSKLQFYYFQETKHIFQDNKIIIETRTTISALYGQNISLIILHVNTASSLVQICKMAIPASILEITSSSAR